MSERFTVPISTAQQQIDALLATRDFLVRMTNPRTMPRVCLDARGEARALLRHYPPRDQLEPLLKAALKPPAEPDAPGKTVLDRLW